MPYVPKFSHLFKIMFGRRDRMAAEGLFLEGSIEFESGDLDAARMMFFYGTRLDPTLAGNFYNLAVVIEKQQGASRKTLEAWRDYLTAAEKDAKQPEETRQKVRAHVRELEQQLETARGGS